MTAASMAAKGLSIGTLQVAARTLQVLSRALWGRDGGFHYRGAVELRPTTLSP